MKPVGVGIVPVQCRHKKQGLVKGQPVKRFYKGIQPFLFPCADGRGFIRNELWIQIQIALPELARIFALQMQEIKQQNQQHCQNFSQQQKSHAGELLQLAADYAFRHQSDLVPIVEAH